jgi:predicted NBD/HSP70 family sugar kinase
MQTSTPATGRRAVSAGHVLRAVLDHGPLPRSTIARVTGLSPASVTAHTAELLASGLLAELPQRVTPSGLGRPSVPLDLNMALGVVAGIHLAVDCATVTLVDLRGAVLTAVAIPHDGADPGTVVAAAGSALVKMLGERAAPGQLLGIGVASGGWIDRPAGLLVEHAMLGWRRVPLADLLADRFGVPVIVDSHVRSLIRAEQLFGDPRARTSALALFVGNVVEAAFALGEQVHYGSRSRAGAIAHLPVPGSDERCGCGKTGCLEATASERRLLHRAAEAGVANLRWITDAVDAAAAGNAVTRELFRERAELVGRTISPIIDLLSPELVLIIDPGIAHLPDCRAALHEQVAANSVTVGDPARSVIVSSFMDTVLATAGSTVLLDALYTNPLAVVGVPRAA